MDHNSDADATAFTMANAIDKVKKIADVILKRLAIIVDVQEAIEILVRIKIEVIQKYKAVGFKKC